VISIIIVSYNTRDLLKQCLESIRAYCPKAEVIVVDNASRDGSARMVEDEFPEITLVELAENRGFAGGNNAGIKQAAGDFILLLNSDTVLEDDTLQRCADWMSQRPAIGAVSPHLVGMDGKTQQCLHRFPNLWTRVRRALWMKPASASDRRESSCWLAGTALMIRCEALRDCGGGLDDGYFMYWEDADLSAKLLEAGWKLAEYKDGHVRHYGGASGGGPDAVRRPDLYAWYAWGEHRWFFRHRPRWEAISLWALDLIDVFRKLVRGAIRPKRRTEWVHSRTLADVLWLRLRGKTPSLPGRS
jgi:GT2 family glycosyltransferase